MTKQIWILRDLPGVAELEARYARIYAHPNPQWAPERDGLDEAVDDLGWQLFGFREDDLFDLGEEQFYETQDFATFYDIDEELIARFATLGWDITDGNGKRVTCHYDLAHRIVVAAKGLMGSLPTPDAIRSRSKVAPEDWGASLEAEARKFRGSSRPRSTRTCSEDAK